MLRFETGREQIEKLLIKEPSKSRFLAAVDQLPKSLRELAHSCLDERLAGRELYKLYESSGTLDELFTLSTPQLEQLFTALFGKLGEAAAATWLSLRTGPYGSFFGSARLFRSSDADELYAQRQLEWLDGVISVFLQVGPDLASAEKLAVWAPYLGHADHSIFGSAFEGFTNRDHIGRLLATVIDSSNHSAENVFDTLRLALEGRHPQSMFDRHVVRAFWRCHRQEAHELLEDYFANTSDSDHRRSIIRGASEGDRPVQRRLLARAIESGMLDNKNVIAEFLPWIGFTCQAKSAEEFKGLFGIALQALSAESVEDVWVEGPEGLRLLFKAWRQALDDVQRSFSMLEGLIHSEERLMRWSACELLIATGHPKATPLLRSRIHDSDLQLAATVLEATNRGVFGSYLKSTPADAPERLNATIALYRRIKTLPETPKWLDQQAKNNLLSSVGSEIGRDWTNESLTLIADLIDNRINFHVLPPGYTPRDPESIAVLLGYLTANPNMLKSSAIGERVLRYLLRGVLSESDWLEVLKLVHDRKRPLGESVVEGFKKETAEKVRNVFNTLMSTARADERILVLKLVCGLADSEHAPTCRAMLPLLSRPVKVRSEHEIQLLARATHVLETEAAAAPADTLALRLFPDLAASLSRQPQPRKPTRLTEACIHFAESLDAFISDNEAKILRTAEHALGRGSVTLADVGLDSQNGCPWVSALHPLWQEWFLSRTPESMDSDGRELVRAATFWNFVVNPIRNTWHNWEAKSLDLSGLAALVTLNHTDMSAYRNRQPMKPWAALSPLQLAALERLSALKNFRLVWSATKALLDLNAEWTDVAFQLDVAESICAAVPKEALQNAAVNEESSNGRFSNLFSNSMAIEHQWMRLPKRLALEAMPKELLKRRTELERWMQRPHPAMDPLKSTVDAELIEAYGNDLATLGDIAERILTERTRVTSACLEFEDVERLRHRYPDKVSAMLGMLDRLATAIIESETKRKPKEVTPLTPFAVRIGYLEGYPHFETVLLAAAKQDFIRPNGDVDSYRNVLSSLIAAIFPSSKDSYPSAAKRLSELLNSKKIKPVTLLRAGFLAPQWLHAIGAALGWKGLRDLHAWLHFHLADDGVNFDLSPELAAWLAEENRQLRQSSAGLINQSDIVDWYREKIFTAYPRLRQHFTPRAHARLNHVTEKWIDVDWFHDVGNSFDDDQWALIAEAASVLSTPKHVSAVLTLADAIRGKTDHKPLLSEIKTSKKPIDIRPIGLVPLESGEARGLDVLERYRAIEDYRTRTKKFHDEHKSSALQMIEQTLKLLSQTAGLASVEQLNWLVAASAAEEFAEHERVIVNALESRLTIDPTGAPVCTLTKDGKRIKTAPEALKKNRQFQAQQNLLKSLQKFAKEARKALEVAMVERQIYKPADLEKMLAHPLLRSMFQSLVFTDGEQVGLLDDGAKKWIQRDGKAIKLPARSQLRIAHPLDLAGHGGWMAWRDVLRERGLTQPFTQVERGIFLPEHFASEAGLREPLLTHWIADDQASAILRSRGWDDPYRRGLQRDFPSDNLSASVRIEWPGLRAPAYQIKEVSFQRLGSDEALPIEQVPAIVFSETLRDLYTAALGARKEDPLLDEDLELLEARKRALSELVQTEQLTNVRWDGNALIIDGLVGSAVVDLLNADVRLLPMQRIPLEYFSVGREQSKAETEAEATDPALSSLLTAVRQLAGEEQALSSSLKNFLSF